MPKRAKKRTTLQQVADRAGVHRSTASRALDPRTRHLITENVVAKVQRAVEQLRYRHNQVAAGLRTNRTRAIGIIVPDITNALFPPIIRGVENRVAEDGFIAMIAHTDGDPAKERSVIETFLSHGSDGLVVASVSLEDDAIAAAAREGTALVTVNRRLEGDTVSSVTHDEIAGIGAVLKHLSDLGHNQFAFLSGPTSSSTGRSRLAAYRHWMRRLSLETNDKSIIEARSFQEDEGRRCTDQLLAAGVRFTALVCASDILAVGAMDTLRKWGVGCPADVSVTGFNDIPFVDRISPSLTTVRGEHYKLGWTAAEMLLQDLALSPGKRTVRHSIIPVTFVARESTGPAPDERGRRLGIRR